MSAAWLLLYWIFNWLVELLPDTWKARLQPFVFVGPAIAILAWYLAIPVGAHVLDQSV